MLLSTIKMATKEEEEPKCGSKERKDFVTKPEPVTLSKRALKRQKLEEKWRAGAEERKLKRKEKKKAKQQAIREGLCSPPAKRRRDAEESGVSVAIDMDFEKYMADRDVKKLAKQVQRCYSVNGRVAKRVKLHLCSFGGRSRQILTECNPGHVNWRAEFASEHYSSVFDKDKIVYLSAESENTLRTLDPGMVYVIGGLVDHNHHKGLCHKLAVERGIAHARLPLDDYIRLQTRRVLTINHVFEILLEFVNAGDWCKAFMTVIPERKGIAVKQSCREQSASDSEADGDSENEQVEACPTSATKEEKEAGKASACGDASNVPLDASATVTDQDT